MKISYEKILKNIYEQIENASPEMISDVEIMIDLLDTPVSAQNLRDAKVLLQKYADSGKAKDFLELYKESGFGRGSLGKSIEWVVAIKAETVVAKKQLQNLYNQIVTGASKTDETKPTPTPVNVDDVEITWDGTGGGETPPPKPTKVEYKDCSDKTENIEFGCISPIVKKIQICLGIHPYNDITKAPTGHFGNITKTKLKELFPDKDVNIITKEMIEKIQSDYCKVPERPETNVVTAADVNPQFFPQNTPQQSYNPAQQVNVPNSIAQNILSVSTERTPEQFYNELRSAGLIIGEDGARRIKYKGPDLDEKQIGDLDMVLDKLGYDRIKSLEDRKRYGSKYVWLKRKTVKS